MMSKIGHYLSLCHARSVEVTLPAASVNKRAEGTPVHYSPSYLVPRSSSLARCRASFFSSAFCVPSGMERLSASTSLATVEKIRPSSEASEGSPASYSPALDRFLCHLAGS